MNKRVSTVLAVLCFCASSADAVTVRGAPSCGTWVKDRLSDDWPQLTDKEWLIGYLSGVAITGRKDFLKGTDNDSLSLWVDNYCHANPLNDVADAGDALSRELIGRKGQ
ncbi:hypothetical protein [Paraburkholderia fungorum]|uniref:hypothetical protein n=1 Tax=Paraburkholderia fungorum TaxID=134537 RepID=UPI0020923896|nr:hypothetical protein [Paraburkholderia fungorum]USU21332.1 hypothetical protein NFE55_30035 [Paraburkholderia fungorum]USU26672.1 hypothetical protein NFS19_31530 [Paraburkholderia fungorum]